MLHIVDSCLVTELEDGLQRLHAADKADIDWLTSWHIKTYEQLNYLEVGC